MAVTSEGGEVTCPRAPGLKVRAWKEAQDTCKTAERELAQRKSDLSETRMRSEAQQAVEFDILRESNPTATELFRGYADICVDYGDVPRLNALNQLNDWENALTFAEYIMPNKDSSEIFKIASQITSEDAPAVRPSVESDNNLRLMVRVELDDDGSVLEVPVSKEALIGYEAIKDYLDRTYLNVLSRPIDIVSLDILVHSAEDYEAIGEAQVAGIYRARAVEKAHHHLDNHKPQVELVSLVEDIIALSYGKEGTLQAFKEKLASKFFRDSGDKDVKDLTHTMRAVQIHQELARLLGREHLSTRDLNNAGDLRALVNRSTLYATISEYILDAKRRDEERTLELEPDVSVH